METINEILKNQDEAAPKVALFFDYEGKVLQASTPVKDADETVGWKNHDMSHSDYWDLYKIINRKFKDIEYEKIPRGRVVYNVDADRFTLYIDKCLNKPDILSQLMGAFSLPRAKTKVGFDEHYVCNNCKGDGDEEDY